MNVSTAAGAGVFFVVWEETVSGNSSVKAAIVNSAGSVSVTDFAVSTRSGQQYTPDVCFYDGNFYVVWRWAEGSEEGISGRCFSIVRDCSCLGVCNREI